MRKWWVVAVAMAWLGTAWAEQPSEQQVRQLMTTIGLGKTLVQMSGQVAGMMQKQLPCVPAETWQNFIDANASEQLIGRMVPVFQKHFSAEDIDGLIRFYSSPLGQKVLTEMPQAMAEATQANAQWSHERMSQLVGQLQKDGKLNASGQCPASGVAADQAGLGDDEDDDAPDVVAPVVSKSAHHSASKAPASKAAHKPASKKAVHKSAPASSKSAATPVAASTTHKPAAAHKAPSKPAVKKAAEKPVSASSAAQG